MNQLEKRIAISEESKRRVSGIPRGSLVTNVCAGKDNPRRYSTFLSFEAKERKNKYGVIHREYFAKCSDGKNTWRACPDVIHEGRLSDGECERLFAPVWEAEYGAA